MLGYLQNNGRRQTPNPLTPKPPQAPKPQTSLPSIPGEAVRPPQPAAGVAIKYKAMRVYYAMIGST